MDRTGRRLRAHLVLAGSAAPHPSSLATTTHPVTITIHTRPHRNHQLIAQHDDITTAVSPLQSPSSPQAPDFKQVRRYYLRTVHQREALGQFIKAGWSPAELAEYARSMYLVSGKTKPTAVSYRFVIEKGVDHELAKEALAAMRAPGYVMPAFDRPEPKDYEWDDPTNPIHSDEVRSACARLARSVMKMYDDKLCRPRRGPETPIRKSLLRKCFRELHAADAFGLRTGARR
jgi:hypothetical protein